jgi:putative OPT family oligopeptide transporter
MLGAMQLFHIPADPSIIAFALLITAVVFSISVVSNDNLQDLKTGQLVAATPWRQQVALIVGCIAGALVIPPILDLLNYSNGFPGGPAAGVPNAQTLAAPQATLIAALAKGVIEGGLRWDLIGIGAIIGVGIILIDEILVRTSGNKRKLPPLAVGIGIYLPMAVTTTVVAGAVIGYVYNRWVSNKPWGEIAKRLGILLASGMIVGESLFGVLNSGVVYATDSAEPFGLVPAGWGGSPLVAMVASVIGLFGIAAGLYVWARGKAAKV